MCFMKYFPWKDTFDPNAITLLKNREHLQKVSDKRK